MIINMTKEHLKDIPDLKEWDSIGPWVEKTLADISSARFDPEAPLLTVMPPKIEDSILGPYGSEAWRKFALAAFVADWACYTQKADRVDFERTLSVASVFPQGLRVHMARSSSGAIVPVGYTGWIPIAKNVFDLLADTPDQVKHRGMIVPLRELSPEGNYLYLFNYSIIEQLRKTQASKMMMHEYAKSIKSQSVLGLCAITVSGDGSRVAELFGMKKTGEVTHLGEAENAYAVRFK